MTLSYANNTRTKLSFFYKCNLSVSRIVLIHDCVVYDGNYKQSRSFKQFSSIFYDVVSLKPMIIPIIGYFLTSVKFRKISQQYQNSMEKGKFRGWAQNSTTHGKLCALEIWRLNLKPKPTIFNCGQTTW